SRQRTKADGDRAAGLVAGPQAPDETRSLVKQRDVGVPKPIDRLFAIADDEDRRLQTVVSDAGSVPPAAHQLAHELPLDAARILELVYEHMAVFRFEPEPAVGKLVHVLQQCQRALEHTRKVHERAGVEGPLIMRQRDRKYPEDAARQDDVQVAA